MSSEEEAGDAKGRRAMQSAAARENRVWRDIEITSSFGIEMGRQIFAESRNGILIIIKTRKCASCARLNFPVDILLWNPILVYEVL